MFCNAVYLGGPKINWMPRILLCLADCISFDENSVTFCIQDAEEKDVAKIEKILRGYGYKVLRFEVDETMEDYGVVVMYYLQVFVDAVKFGKVQKNESGMVQ